MTITPQPAVLAPLAPVGRSLTFRLRTEMDPSKDLARLSRDFDPNWGVIGLGAPLVQLLGGDIPGLRAFPSFAGGGIAVPSTQGAVWIYLRGQTPSEIFDRSEVLSACLGRAFDLDESTDTFLYRDGRDLTGYLDGTANPPEEEAPAAVLLAQGDGLVGSSFASVQRWAHDLGRFRGHAQAQRDAIIGRELASNEEIEDAPANAHVKRVAVELYAPDPFMVRRSMPWANASGQGLEFVAYGRSLDGFEKMMNRMVGADDGIVDALFRFSRPVTGAHYWCPARRRGGLDLGRLGV